MIVQTTIAQMSLEELSLSRPHFSFVIVSSLSSSSSTSSSAAATNSEKTGKSNLHLCCLFVLLFSLFCVIFLWSCRLRTFTMSLAQMFYCVRAENKHRKSKAD